MRRNSKLFRVQYKFNADWCEEKEEIPIQYDNNNVDSTVSKCNGVVTIYFY